VKVHRKRPQMKVGSSKRAFSHNKNVLEIHSTTFEDNSNVHTGFDVIEEQFDIERQDSTQVSPNMKHRGPFMQFGRPKFLRMTMDGN